MNCKYHIHLGFIVIIEESFAAVINFSTFQFFGLLNINQTLQNFFPPQKIFSFWNCYLDFHLYLNFVGSFWKRYERDRFNRVTYLHSIFIETTILDFYEQYMILKFIKKQNYIWCIRWTWNELKVNFILDNHSP